MNSRMSHEAASERLPWFVNGTLSDDERERVAAHLDECSACREALALNRDIAAVVRSDRAIPIPPVATADRLLRGADGARSRHPVPGWRAAAATAAVVVTAVLAFGLFREDVPSNQQFNAATDASHLATVGYVFEIRFDSAVDALEREQILREIGGTARPVDAGDGVYQLTLALPPQALADLEARAASIAARDEVASAEVVALQVPVR